MGMEEIECVLCKNPLPLQTCLMAFLKLMHPGGSLDHNYYGPMPATCMAARIVTICAIYQKRNFYLSHFAAGLSGL